MIQDIAILIPSLDPDENILKYFDQLTITGFENIIIVDDGSTKNKNYYNILEQKGGIVLHHNVNMGKGRALKTGINYILRSYTKETIKGVVTADADGQHSAEDTFLISERLREDEEFILGCRKFNSSNVPLKSSLGNRLTTIVFALLYGKKVADTQTGLRGIPYSLLEECTKCAGERFEYETNVLIKMVKIKAPIVEIPIETIYFNSNRETHFSAVKDSARIYYALIGQGLMFLISSLSSFVIDVLIFSFITKVILADIYVPMATLWATVAARIVSCTYNFCVNKKHVFKSTKRVDRAAWRYGLLAICQLIISWIFVVLIWRNTKMDTTIIKMVVDVTLFFLSYQMQKRWVF